MKPQTITSCDNNCDVIYKELNISAILQVQIKNRMQMYIKANKSIYFLWITVRAVTQLYEDTPCAPNQPSYNKSFFTVEWTFWHLFFLKSCIHDRNQYITKNLARTRFFFNKNGKKCLGKYKKCYLFKEFCFFSVKVEKAGCSKVPFPLPHL